MAFELSRVDRLTRTIDLAAKFPGRTPITAAQVALLAPRSTPNASTVWYTVTVASNIATVLFAGPDADPTGALVVAGSADLWVKIAASSEVDAAKVERITVLGGGSVPIVPLDRGLPSGGTTGQVLTKASSNPYDAEWGASTGGGAVSSVNTKTGAVVLSASDVGADAAGAATAAQAAAVQRANHTGTQTADTLTDGTTNKAFLATERTKLTGVATGATANATDAQLRDRSTHTGTQSADTLTDGTTNKAYTATERTKLTGVATGATANSTDATLLARANHTGTQAASTVTGLAAVATSGAYSDLTGQPAAPSSATTTAQGIVELATGAETISGTDTVRAVTPAGAKAAISASISAASRTAVGNRGKIVWIVDDALVSQRDIATPKIEAVGGKLNFAVNWNNVGLNAATMIGTDITALYNAGHQIMSHSMTHPDMTTQTPAQRMAEWDTAKANLEGLTAVGAITDFVYPNNATNLATTTEAYGRYLRTFSGPNPGLIRPTDNALNIQRATWGSGTHQMVLATIRRIAVTGENYVLYCHGVDVSGVSAINPTMLDEAIALATSLGVQWARADEALTTLPVPFLDFGFETGDLTGAYHAITSKGTGCTIDIVDDTPSAGLPGTKSLRIVNDGSGTLNRVAPVGTFPPPRAGEEYTLSAHLRQDKTSGTGGGHLIIRQWDEFGVNLGDTASTVLNAAGTGITPWTQVSVAFTVNKLTRGFQVWCAQSTMIGTTWFDHLHFGPTRLGVLG